MLIKSRTNRIAPLDQNILPDANEAKIQYEGFYNGALTEELPFGLDPLNEYDERKIRRNREFFQNHNIQRIYEDCVHDRAQLL